MFLEFKNRVDLGYGSFHHLSWQNISLIPEAHGTMRHCLHDSTSVHGACETHVLEERVSEEAELRK